MAETSTQNVYLPIADAKKTLNKRLNLFAKISELGLPRKSKGTDYVLALKVIDQSCPPPGLSVTFFAENTKKLPNVKSAGDMIALHYVEMKIYKGEVYCLFGKKVSSFALFNGKTNMAENPYQTSPKYNAAVCVKEMLLEMRTLSLQHQSDGGLIKWLSLLRNIEDGRTCDMICKVLHVCKISTDDWMLFVWDGTDTPLVTYQTDLDKEKEKPTPLYLEPLLLSKEILCSFPCEGTVFRISAARFFEDIHHMRGCDLWVKLCNVTCKLQLGMWSGAVNSLSKVFILPDEDDKVKYRKRIYDERRASKLERLPVASFPEPSYVTEIDHKSAAYATLMDSITWPKVEHRLKCVVRVVASCPWRGEDLRSPRDGHYRIRLTLEDPTARVHAYIYEEDGVKFFGGNPTADVLTEKMSKLLGIKEHGSKEGRGTTRNPPWIWCCLMSYYLDEKDPFGSRRYRIIDTWVVD